MSSSADMDALIKRLSRLPGLGPRSARRLALHLLDKKEQVMHPLMMSLQKAHDTIRPCGVCGNLDSSDPCAICSDQSRSTGQICLIQNVSDLWAVERTRIFKGRYHILGGLLSALDGIGPDDLSIKDLLARLEQESISEVIVALSATVDGQATAHYVSDTIHKRFPDIEISRLAHGVPVGGELDYLDEGTLMTALKSRAKV